MKVIAFNGSPHRDGVIGKGLALMAGVLSKEGVETEIVEVGAEKIRGCIDCRKCKAPGLGRCAFNDDIVNSAADKVNAADGMIMGAPVYYGSIAGAFKCFLDRLFFPGINLEWKPVSAFVSCRRSGGINAFHQLNNYFNLARAIITPSVYWGVLHGNNAKESEGDREGIHILESSAANLAWLLKALEFGKEKIPLPPKAKRVWTNFIH
ncbi:MAG: flavodoxin family protein [Treponema sp.]|nr:flavodoxin family protein [Treponema sp.]